MTEYAWKPKSGITIDPQAAGEAIEELRQKLGGQVAPADVLSLARSPNSPLHGAFEWDDTEAAAKYRLAQAGHVLRCLTVTVSIRPEAPATPMRAFVSVTEPRTQQRGYVSLGAAMDDQEYRNQVVQRAWNELQLWREKYKDYQELARAVAAVSAVLPGDKAA